MFCFRMTVYASERCAQCQPSCTKVHSSVTSTAGFGLFLQLYSQYLCRNSWRLSARRLNSAKLSSAYCWCISVMLR